MIPLYEVDLSNDRLLSDRSIRCFYCLERDIPENLRLIDLKYALDHESRRFSFFEAFSGIFLLPKEPSLARMRGWFVSRSALIGALRQSVYAKGSDASVSIAHTAGIGIVGIISDRAKIGVDVERADRVIQQKVVRRIANEADVKLPSGLDIWLIKEAVFKGSNLGGASLADVAVIAKLSRDSYLCQIEDSSYHVGLFFTADNFRISVCTQLTNSF